MTCGGYIRRYLAVSLRLSEYVAKLIALRPPEQLRVLSIVAVDLIRADRVRVGRRHIALVDEGWSAAVLIWARNVLKCGSSTLIHAGSLEARGVLGMG